MLGALRKSVSCTSEVMPKPSGGVAAGGGCVQRHDRAGEQRGGTER